MLMCPTHTTHLTHVLRVRDGLCMCVTHMCGTHRCACVFDTCVTCVGWVLCYVCVSHTCV